MLSEAEKNPLSATEKKAAFQRRKKSWYDENSAKVIAKHSSSKPNEHALANATNAKPTSWQTLAITPPAKQANMVLYETRSDCATVNPYRQNKISTTISSRSASAHQRSMAEYGKRKNRLWNQLQQIISTATKPLRSLAEAAQDILALENRADGSD